MRGRLHILVATCLLGLTAPTLGQEAEEDLDLIPLVPLVPTEGFPDPPDAADAPAATGKATLAPEERQPDASAAPEAALAISEPAARPVHRTWWFWTLIAVAAAGATGTAVALSGPEYVLPEGSLGSLDGR